MSTVFFFDLEQAAAAQIVCRIRMYKAAAQESNEELRKASLRGNVAVQTISQSILRRCRYDHSIQTQLSSNAHIETAQTAALDTPSSVQ